MAAIFCLTAGNEILAKKSAGQRPALTSEPPGIYIESQIDLATALAS